MPQRSILITGCSSGIGYETAKALQARGYQVFAAVRKPQDVMRLQQEGLETLLLDVNDEDSIRNAISTILAKTNGRLDALFNNAGFLQLGAIEDLNRDLIRQQFETNVFGPMELIRQILPVMRKQGHGRIIQNSSILGVITLPYYGAYNASKFALEGFSHTLRQELRGTNIHVSILNPGPIKSALRDNAYALYKTVERPDSAYASAYADLETNYFQAKNTKAMFTLQPDAVTKKLIHALESPRPKARYYIGLPANFLGRLRRFLPDGVLDWLLAKLGPANQTLRQE